MTRLPRGPIPREMQSERCLADALIEERDDHRAPAEIENRTAQTEGSGWLWPEADQAMTPTGRWRGCWRASYWS